MVTRKKAKFAMGNQSAAALLAFGVGGLVLPDGAPRGSGVWLDSAGFNRVLVNFKV